MPEDFAERMSRLPELSDDELAQLESDIVTAFDAADEASDLETMQELADILDQVREEIANRHGGEPEAEAAPEDAEAAPPADEMTASGEQDEVAKAAEPETPPENVTEPTAETTAQTPEGENPPAEAEATTEAESSTEDDESSDPDPQGETPSDTTPQSEEQQVATEITADDVPEENVPVAAAAPVATIRAGGDIPGITAGTELDGMDAVVDAMTRKINSMRGVGGAGEQIIVASIQNPEADEDHILRAGDLEGNSRKVRALISDPANLTPEALTAGGWCAPRTPLYDVPTVGSTERPLQSGLPTFRADRGGVTWVQPPVLSAVDGAVSLWRHDGSSWKAYTDPTGETLASPNDEKPKLHISCGSEQSVDVDAVPMHVTFDNMTARAFPEWVKASTELTLVAQARFAEQKTLSQMFSLSVSGSGGTVSDSIGVARDFFRGVRIAAAAKRHEHRMSKDAPLTAVLPSWLATAIGVDLGLGQEFDIHGDSEVNAWLGELNLQPIWYIDDVPGQSAFSSESAFPATANWLLFPTGTYVRLDSGELNLGVVRTETDIKKNTYTEFSETFETVAHFGPAGYNWTVRGATTVNLYGSFSAGTELTPGS